MQSHTSKHILRYTEYSSDEFLMLRIFCRVLRAPYISQDPITVNRIPRIISDIFEVKVNSVKFVDISPTLLEKREIEKWLICFSFVMGKLITKEVFIV